MTAIIYKCVLLKLRLVPVLGDNINLYLANSVVQLV